MKKIFLTLKFAFLKIIYLVRKLSITPLIERFLTIMHIYYQKKL